MACSITINAVLGEEANGHGTGLTKLIIRGTPVGCQGVCLKITQTRGLSPHVSTQERCARVNSAGVCEFQFALPAALDAAGGTLPPVVFRCGDENKMVFEARCQEDGTSCTVEMEIDPNRIVCDQCPKVDFAVTDVSIGPCSTGPSPATRRVSFSGSVESQTGVAVAHVEVSPAGGGNAVNTAPVIANPTGTLDPADHHVDLVPGSYVAALVIDEPEGCPGARVEFEVPPCDDTGGDPDPSPVCPTGIIRATVGDCDSQGRRPVDISVDVLRSAPGELRARLLNPLNESGPPLDQRTATTGDLNLRSPAGHVLPPGSYTLKVEIDRPRGCRAILDDLEVPACGGGSPPDDDDDDPPPPPGGGDEEGNFCAFLRIAGLFAVIIGFVLGVAGAATINPALCAAGAVFMVIGFLLLLWWAYSCASHSPCSILQGLIRIVRLLLLLSLLLGLLAALLGLLGLPADAPCALGLLLDAGLLGWLLAVLYPKFIEKGCRWVPVPDDILFGG